MIINSAIIQKKIDTRRNIVQIQRCTKLCNHHFASLCKTPFLDILKENIDNVTHTNNCIYK